MLNAINAERPEILPVLREHQGRQQEAGLQNIADTWLPLDVRAHRLQACDVATDGPQRDPGFMRKLESCHRPAVPTQDLHEVE